MTHSEQEKTTRRARVVAAKDALSRSASLDGRRVVAARSALKQFLRQLNEPSQPSDRAFQELLDAPFRESQQRDGWRS